MAGGANKVSLIEAQRNYQDFGACDEHGRRYVRPLVEDEPLDPAWRPIDLTRNSFEDWAAEDRAPCPTTARCSDGGSPPSGATITGWHHGVPLQGPRPQLGGVAYGARTRLVGIGDVAPLAPGDQPARSNPCVAPTAPAWDGRRHRTAGPMSQHLLQLRDHSSYIRRTEGTGEPKVSGRGRLPPHHAGPWQRTGVTHRIEVTGTAEGRSRSAPHDASPQSQPVIDATHPSVMHITRWRGALIAGSRTSGGRKETGSTFIPGGTTRDTRSAWTCGT
ncbi:CPCC family cysteine-rich protein [Streptomyces sp. NPDC015144]|uniref:CPCC family cysteine-rich protein n=1 Tax=Streptomyces sp. NPDC015144 TaxID=3364944 RepID=UPI0036FA1A8D